MKIKNMNDWLPRPYYPVYKNGKHIGSFTTLESAEKAFKGEK